MRLNQIFQRPFHLAIAGATSATILAHSPTVSAQSSRISTVEPTQAISCAKQRTNAYVALQQSIRQNPDKNARTRLGLYMNNVLAAYRRYVNSLTEADKQALDQNLDNLFRGVESDGAQLDKKNATTYFNVVYKCNDDTAPPVP